MPSPISKNTRELLDVFAIDEYRFCSIDSSFARFLNQISDTSIYPSLEEMITCISIFRSELQVNIRQALCNYVRLLEECQIPLDCKFYFKECRLHLIPRYATMAYEDYELLVDLDFQFTRLERSLIGHECNFPRFYSIHLAQIIREEMKDFYRTYLRRRNALIAGLTTPYRFDVIVREFFKQHGNLPEDQLTQPPSPSSSPILTENPKFAIGSIQASMHAFSSAHKSISSPLMPLQQPSKVPIVPISVQDFSSAQIPQSPSDYQPQIQSQPPIQPQAQAQLQPELQPQPQIQPQSQSQSQPQPQLQLQLQPELQPQQINLDPNHEFANNLGRGFHFGGLALNLMQGMITEMSYMAYKSKANTIQKTFISGFSRSLHIQYSLLVELVNLFPSCQLIDRLRMRDIFNKVINEMSDMFYRIGEFREEMPSNRECCFQSTITMIVQNLNLISEQNERIQTLIQKWNTKPVKNEIQRILMKAITRALAKEYNLFQRAAVVYSDATACMLLPTLRRLNERIYTIDKTSTLFYSLISPEKFSFTNLDILANYSIANPIYDKIRTNQIYAPFILIKEIILYRIEYDKLEWNWFQEVSTKDMSNRLLPIVGFAEMCYELRTKNILNGSNATKICLILAEEFNKVKTKISMHRHILEHRENHLMPLDQDNFTKFYELARKKISAISGEMKQELDRICNKFRTAGRINRGQLLICFKACDIIKRSILFFSLIRKSPKKELKTTYNNLIDQAVNEFCHAVEAEKNYFNAFSSNTTVPSDFTASGKWALSLTENWNQTCPKFIDNLRFAIGELSKGFLISPPIDFYALEGFIISIQSILTRASLLPLPVMEFHEGDQFVIMEELIEEYEYILTKNKIPLDLF